MTGVMSRKFRVNLSPRASRPLLGLFLKDLLLASTAGGTPALPGISSHPLTPWALSFYI